MSESPGSVLRPGGRTLMRRNTLPPSLLQAYDFMRWVEKKYPPTQSPFRRARYTENVEIRWMCWFVMRDIWHLRLRQVSRLFAYDHATIIYGLKNITYEMIQRAVQLEAEFMQTYRKETP